MSIDDYELGAMLGTGAMGEVYRAEQKSLARPVAVKFLKCREADEKQVVERFLREAQTTARMRHPNIVDVRGIGRAPDGRYFLVMDFVDGINLAERIGQGPLAVEEAVDINCCVALAVEHAHSCGVVHRDLKPANILIDQQGRILVTDFGLAKCFDTNDPALSMPGYVIGTPQHMAPEQVDGRIGTVGPATDVYGLGSLLYTLLTGQPPYSGGTTLEVLMKVTAAEPITPPSKIRSEIPPAVEATCLKCLSRLPQDRFGSAAEVREALLGAGDTLTSTQPTVVVSKPANSAAARRRVAVSAIAAFLILAAFVIVVWRLTDRVWSAGSRGQAPPVPTSDQSVRVEWNVDVFPEGQSERRVALAASSQPVSNGDMVRLRLDFSRPAYAYVFWIGADGSLQCLYPKPGQPQGITGSLEIPSNYGKGLPIEGPEGTELCVVVLRESILEDPVESFARWTPDSAVLAGRLEVALLDGYPVLRQVSTVGTLESPGQSLINALARLPVDAEARSLGPEESLAGASSAESLWRWQNSLPDELGSVHWLAIPHRADDDSSGLVEMAAGRQ